MAAAMLWRESCGLTLTYDLRLSKMLSACHERGKVTLLALKHLAHPPSGAFLAWFEASYHVFVHTGI